MYDHRAIKTLKSWLALISPGHICWDKAFLFHCYMYNIEYHHTANANTHPETCSKPWIQSRTFPKQSTFSIIIKDDSSNLTSTKYLKQIAINSIEIQTPGC